MRNALIRSIKMMIWKNQKGFTLVELLVAMGLSLVVLGAGYSVFRVQTHTVKAQEFKMEAQEDARAALDMMVREVRNLGFFPSGTPCPAPANTTGIVAATATTLQFVYDANGDGSCAGTMATGAGADESVTYILPPPLTIGDITRDINDGNGAQVLTAGNVTNAAFTYFDGAGAVTADPASIRRVSITLTVQSRSTDVQFGGLIPITMNSNVDLRNRGNG
jgi:prepilin-type N-terminal cleavage/methylation domain-containing protein